MLIEANEMLMLGLRVENVKFRVVLKLKLVELRVYF